MKSGNMKDTRLGYFVENKSYLKEREHPGSNKKAMKPSQVKSEDNKNYTVSKYQCVLVNIS